MKCIRIAFLLLVFCVARGFAQNTDIQLARQFSANGEDTKALEIYQKLYRQDNDTYYNDYLNGLLKIRKFDEAESITKKMMRKYPSNLQFTVALGRVYREAGKSDKVDAIYNDIIKNLPGDYNSIVSLATQFYQAENTDFAIKVFLQGRKGLKNENAFTLELISLYRFKRNKQALVTEYLNFLPQNPGYLLQAENTLSTIFENAADYDILRTELLKRIQADPQQIVYPELLTWQYLQQKDFEQALNQALALSRRRNDDGNNILDLAQTLSNNGAYDEAIRGYEYLLAKGTTSQYYVVAKVELINVKNLKLTAGKFSQADLVGLEKDYTELLNELGRTPGTVFAMQKLARLQAFKLQKPADGQKLLEDALKIPGVNPQVLAACKLDLGDIYLMTGQPWEATLLYSQVEKGNSGTNITQDAKLRNAKLAYYTGDFKWAKGQLDVLKAATSQLIANDALNLSLLIGDNLQADTSGAALKIYARADMLIFFEQPEKAVLTLDSIDKKYPNNSLVDDILMSKARIYIQQKNFNAAINPLQTIIEKHSYDLWADDAVFMLANIYENQLQDKEKAKILYQKIITDYPSSLYINEARKRFRTLRGDKLNGAS